MNRTRLQKIESVNRTLAPALIFAATSAWFFQQLILASDLFWHLAAGRDICQRGSVPLTDSFSYTFEGKQWLNHEWLWDVVYWNIYRSSPDAVAWFTIGLFVLIFALQYLLAYQVTGSIFASGLAVWLSALASHWFLDIRPHVVTLLLTALVLVTRHWRWAHWMWPPLIVLWANLHAGFVFGVGLVGLLVLVRIVEQSRQARKPSIPWGSAGAVALCLVAWLVNPFGWRLIEFPWQYMHGSTAYTQLNEWQSPPLSLDPTYFEGQFWWLAILALAAILCGATRQFDLLLLTAVTFLMAWQSQRFIPLFALTATPLVALSLRKLRDVCATRWHALDSTWAGVAASLVTLLVALGMWSQTRISSSLLRDWTMGDMYPEEAVRYLNSLGPPRRVLNNYDWGGFIMLHAPEAKVFIDGRANTLYDETVYRHYLTCVSGKPTSEILARYPADIALLPPGAFAYALVELTPPWTMIYRDPRAVLLAPPGSPLASSNAPDPEEVLQDGVYPLTADAYRQWDRENYPAAAEALEAALLRKPYAMSIYSFLAQVYARMNDAEKIESLVERGTRQNPRQTHYLRTIEGSAYIRMDEPQRALAAFKAGMSHGPFFVRETHYKRIEKAEAEIERGPP